MTKNRKGDGPTHDRTSGPDPRPTTGGTGGGVHYDMNKPEDRARILEDHGPAAYSKALDEWRKARTVCVVNGHAIRWLMTTRYGLIYEVGDTGFAYGLLDKAKAKAAEIVPPLREAVLCLFETRERLKKEGKIRG